MGGCPIRARRQRQVIEGDAPSPINPPRGCRFHTRCPRVMPVCREVEPQVTLPAPGRQVACRLYPAA